MMSTDRDGKLYAKSEHSGRGTDPYDDLRRKDVILDRQEHGLIGIVQPLGLKEAHLTHTQSRI